jgi:hypothetical protein
LAVGSGARAIFGRSLAIGCCTFSIQLGAP